MLSSAGYLVFLVNAFFVLGIKPFGQFASISSSPWLLFDLLYYCSSLSEFRHYFVDVARRAVLRFEEAVGIFILREELFQLNILVELLALL